MAPRRCHGTTGAGSKNATTQTGLKLEHESVCWRALSNLSRRAGTLAVWVNLQDGQGGESSQNVIVPEGRLLLHRR